MGNNGIMTVKCPICGRSTCDMINYDGFRYGLRLTSGDYWVCAGNGKKLMRGPFYWGGGSKIILYLISKDELWLSYAWFFVILYV